MRALGAKLAARGKELVPLLADGNLVDAAWGAAQPPLPAAPLRVHPLRWAGQAAAEKIAQARGRAAAAGAGALLVTGLDEVAWLLNLRGSDVDYNPVFVAYALVDADGARLYVDSAKVAAGDGVAAHLEEAGVEVGAGACVCGGGGSRGGEGRGGGPYVFVLCCACVYVCVCSLGTHESAQRAPRQHLGATTNTHTHRTHAHTHTHHTLPPSP